MPDLTIWRMPQPAGPKARHVVVRGPSGRCYGLPELVNAWPILQRLGYLPRLRWQEGKSPKHEPMSPRAAEALASWLGLPGYPPAEDSEQVELINRAELTLADLEQIEKTQIVFEPVLIRHSPSGKRPITPEDVLAMARRQGVNV